jgi:putative addiction module CopG family antidote
MEITLPRKLDGFVKEEVAAGNYNTPSELVAEAMRELQARKEQQFETAEFERLIDEGKASPKRELTGAAWREIKPAE